MRFGNELESYFGGDHYGQRRAISFATCRCHWWRVYYQHLPKKFVAGTVYDRRKKEVIIGATCTLKDKASGDTHTAETDNWGDFWFRGLEDDRTFTLSIEKGKKSKTIDNIVTEKDLSLGDIPMG